MKARFAKKQITMKLEEFIEDVERMGIPNDATIIVSGGIYNTTVVENWEPQSFEYCPITNEIILTQE